MHYADTLRKHRRLAILRYLEQSQEFTSNISLITDLVNGVGVQSTRDQIATEISWLAENGFVSVEDNGGFIVTQATQAGVEIALGRASHPQIQRRSPGH
ncbi:MAG: hypothetical protein AAF755_10285 [Pseudomonadota bacterium]